MLIRTLSAIVMVPLLLGLSYLGGMYTAFLTAAISILALLEFLGIGRQMGYRTWPKTSLVAAVVWLTNIFVGSQDLMLPLLVLWLLISFGKLAIGYPHVRLEEAIYNFLALIYTIVLLSYLYLLRQLPRGTEWVFMAFFLVWTTDTGAYLVGRAFGRHRLAPEISPNKTIEGAIGGFLGSMIVALIYAKIIGGVPYLAILALGIVVGITGQIGDLFESAIKRIAKVKDSGQLIPGHGGILDRFDSFVFVLPVVYYWVLLAFMR